MGATLGFVLAACLFTPFGFVVGGAFMRARIEHEQEEAREAKWQRFVRDLCAESAPRWISYTEHPFGEGTSFATIDEFAPRVVEIGE